MSLGLDYLHSHSGLERELRMEKRFVLVDASFSNLFLEDPTKKVKIHKTQYIQVSTLSFVKHGGIFKNLDA